MAVLGNNTETFLTGLSDFWQRFFADRDTLKGLYAGAEQMLGQAYLDMVTEVLNVNLQDMPLFNREFWKLMTIREDLLRFRNGGWEFELPDGIAFFQFLTNRIYNPTVALERGIDFSLDEDTRTISFATNPFDVGLDGVPSRQVDITPTIFLTGLDGDFDTGAPRTFSVRGFVRAGLDGVLPVPGSSNRFESASAQFDEEDIGRVVVFTYDGVTYDGEGLNPAPPEILAVLDSTTVLMDTAIPIGALPENIPWELREQTVFASTDVGDDLVLQDPVTPGVSYTVEIVAVDPGGLSVTVDRDIGISVTSEAVPWTHQSKSRVTEYVFWIPDAFIDRENLWLSFGYLVDRYEVTSESYRALLQGIFRYFILGPTVGLTEAALNVMSGIPVIREDGEVITSIDTSEAAFDIVYTDRRSYEIPKGSLKTTITVGTVMEAFEALTSIFVVADHVEDPDWYYGEIIPRELVEDSNTTRRNVDPALYHNVVGSPRWFIGDPGYYVGADDTKFIPVAKAGLDGRTTFGSGGGEYMTSHLQKFYEFEVGQYITIQGVRHLITEVGTTPEPYVRFEGDSITAELFASNYVATVAEPALGNGRILLTSSSLTQDDVGRFVRVNAGTLGGQDFLIDQVHSATVATLVDIDTGAEPVLVPGDISSVFLGLTWEVEARAPLKHTTGYLFMRDFLKQHVFSVSYSLTDYPDIPYPRLDDDIRKVLLEGKPAYVTMFFNPSNFFYDQVFVAEEDLEVAARVELLDEMQEIGGQLVIGDTWDIGDYYYYGAPLMAWYDVIRQTQLGSVTPLPQSENMAKVALTASIEGGTTPTMEVTLYAWNGVTYVPTGDIFVLDPEGTNIAFIDSPGTSLAVSATVTGGPTTFSLDYGYMTAQPETIIATEAAGYTYTNGVLSNGSYTFTAAGFEFGAGDHGRIIAAYVAGEHKRYYIWSVVSKTQLHLIDVDTGEVANFVGESNVPWRLGPPRRTATPVVIGGAEPAVPHPSEVGGAGNAYMQSWPIAVTVHMIPPPPLMGMVFADMPELEAAILAEPSLFEDGTPVYVTTINFNTPEGDDPITTDGWVVVYDGVPVPVITPTLKHYDFWLEEYNPPDGSWTYVTEMESGSGDGGGFVVNVDGEPVPTAAIGGGGTCGSSVRTSPAFPMSLVGGEDITTNYSAAALPAVDDVP